MCKCDPTIKTPFCGKPGCKSPVQPIPFETTEHGFKWGSAHVRRAFQNSEDGWVTLILETPKFSGHDCLQIYVTKTGKVRISDARGEWIPPIQFEC